MSYAAFAWLFLWTSPGAPALDSEAARTAAIGRASACTIRTNRHAARAIARAIPGSEAERAAEAGMVAFLQKCLARARIPDNAETRVLLAGRIAQDLYLSRHSGFFARHIPVPGAVPAAREQAAARETEGWPVEAAVAECIVAVAANDADRLLRSKAGSRAEEEAATTVAARLPGCLAKDRRLRISRPRLRAEVSRAFYRSLAPILEGELR